MRKLAVGIILLLAGCFDYEPIRPLPEDLGIAPFAPDPGGAIAKDDWFVLPLDDAAHGFVLDVPEWAVISHESGWRYVSLEYKVLTARSGEPVDEFLFLLFVATPEGLELREGVVEDRVQFNWTRDVHGETFSDDGVTEPTSRNAHWIRIGVPPEEEPPDRVVAVVSGDTRYATGVVFAWAPRILSGFEAMWGDGWRSGDPSVVYSAVNNDATTVGRLIQPAGSSAPWRHESVLWEKTDPARFDSISRLWTDGFADSQSLRYTDVDGAYTSHGVGALLPPGGFGFVQTGLGARASGDWSVAATAGSRVWQHAGEFRLPARQTPAELFPAGLDGIYLDSLPQMRLQGDHLGTTSLDASWTLDEAPAGAMVIAQIIQAPTGLASLTGMDAAEITCTVDGAGSDIQDPILAGAPPSADPGLWRHSTWCYQQIPRTL